MQCNIVSATTIVLHLALSHLTQSHLAVSHLAVSHVAGSYLAEHLDAEWEELSGWRVELGLLRDVRRHGVEQRRANVDARRPRLCVWWTLTEVD